MKPRDYCCCAIPLVNAGIYATLLEQFIVSLLVGILSIATPSVVGAATPSFASWILAIICFVLSGLQVLGYLGVAREKAILYRRYATLHGIAIMAAFAVSATWIIISASRHSTAKSNCLKNFFPSDPTSEGDTLCDIFPWVDIGIMGGLWVLLAIVQAYLFFVLSSYGSSQRADHTKYDQLNNSDSFPMNARSDPWDTRASTDSLDSPGKNGSRTYNNHLRQESGASVSEMLSQPPEQPKDSFSNYYGSYPPQTQPYMGRQPSRKEPTQLVHAYTHDPTPTPQYTNNFYNDSVADQYLTRPSQTQIHPGEPKV